MGLKRVYKSYGRAYEDDDSNIYPGVTTILNILEKKLGWWQMTMCGNYIFDQIEAVHRGERTLDRKAILSESKKAPDNYRDERGALGTRIHDVIARHLLHEDIRKDLIDDPRLTAIIAQLDKYIRDNSLEPVLVEAYLLSKEHVFAGAVDLVAKQDSSKYGKQTILVDVKTGKTLMDTHTWQMAAYAKAYEEMYGDPIDMCFILHVDYDNQIVKEERHLHKKDIPAAFAHFLNIYGAFKARYAKQLEEKK
jgi:CRISPR/Cas system-associated exonuclease Cas4 (RecB family)